MLYGHSEKSLCYSALCGGAGEFSEFAGDDIYRVPGSGLVQGGSDHEIKSLAPAEFAVRSIAIDVPQDASAVPLRLDPRIIGLAPEQALEVIFLPGGAQIWTAASQDYLRIGDVICARDLAALQFLPSRQAAQAISMLKLRVIGGDGETVIISVTMSTGSGASAGARVQQRTVASVDIDPLAFGLMTALAASMVSAPVAALPSQAPDAGAPNDRSDGQAHAGLAPGSDDPTQDPATDEPSATGSVPKSDGQGARSSDAHRRWVGSGTPPDVWHSHSPIETWTAGDHGQPMTPPRPQGVGFKDERFAATDAAGWFGLPPASVSSQAVSGAPVPTPGATLGTARPVAANDGGYLVLNGKKSIQTAVLLANDTASPGLHLSMDGVSAAHHGTVTYDASSQEITFVATAGYRGNASFSYTVKDDEGRSAQATVTLFVVPDETLFDAGARPVMDRVDDPNAVELGVRFVSASDGVIAGLRFYKGADNVGLHTASLWDSSGTLLATATFNGETGSGWQQVAFSSPVAIRAGVTYVASYHTDGMYAANPGYFASPVTSGDLTAIGSVYAYGSSSVFPTNSYNANNYWVDVVYNKPPEAPEALDDMVGAIASGRSTSIASSLLLANDRNPDGLPLSVTAAGSAVNGTVSYDALAKAVIFTPASGYTGAAGFSYTVTNSLGASASADVQLWVAGSQPAMFFDAATVPTVVKANDSNSVELGFKFHSAVDGDVVGLRFFKGADNTGSHVGSLWSATGDLLATATFANETAEGWQQVMFATPVSLTAGVSYVASYHTDGNYSADPGFFANSHSSGMLIAPASTPGNANGLFAYGSSSLFPTDSFNATGYAVDVLFKANLTG